MLLVDLTFEYVHQDEKVITDLLWLHGMDAPALFSPSYDPSAWAQFIYRD